MTTAQVLHGEALHVLAELEDDSFDAIVTDPPYGLSATSAKKVSETMTHWVSGDRTFVPGGSGFMGRGWDSFVPPPAVWDECLRVLRPGGHLLAFSGSRTYDIMGLSIRLAGFEIRDGLAWLYGSGMPHGQKIARSMSGEEAEEWEGWSTALKPANEPIVLARKPLSEQTVVGNTLLHGTGALNTSAAEITYKSGADKAEAEEKNRHADFGSAPGRNTIYGDFTSVASKNYSSSGRHPANVVLTHGPECVELGETEVATTTHFPKKRGKGGLGSSGHSGQDDLVEQSPSTETVESWDCGPGCPVAAIDEQGRGVKGAGGPSRFFHTGFIDPEMPGFYEKKAPSSQRPSYTDEQGNRVAHVSVKPLDLMRWLVRLSVRKGGSVLDPFAGSGTTLEACILEGADCVGVEREPEYLPLIRQRLQRHSLEAEGGPIG